MRPTDATVYTNVSQEQYDRFRAQSKIRGLNIGTNSEDVVFDLIPVKVLYNPTTKVLTFTVTEPFWINPGVTAGVLHGMVAAAMATPPPVPIPAPAPVPAATK
jgi:hypothetical protein